MESDVIPFDAAPDRFFLPVSAWHSQTPFSPWKCEGLALSGPPMDEEGRLG